MFPRACTDKSRKVSLFVGTATRVVRGEDGVNPIREDDDPTPGEAYDPSVHDGDRAGVEPMGEQIAAHERYLTVARELAAARADRDEAEIRRLEPLCAQAKREWQRLVREAQAVMRKKRPRSR
jgi:hypothetical protein